MAREPRSVTVACKDCLMSHVLSSDDLHVQDLIREFRSRHVGHDVVVEFGEPQPPAPPVA